MWDPVKIGRRGGISKSARKVAAARRNAKLGAAKGGRPPKLPPEPQGYRDSWNLPLDSPEHALKKFFAYYAEVVVKRNLAARFFSEREFCASLRLSGRRDLVARRKAWWAKQTNAVKLSHRKLFEHHRKALGHKSESQIRVEAILARMQGTAAAEEPFSLPPAVQRWFDRLFQEE